MNENLRKFTEKVMAVPRDEKAEQFVRDMVSGVAKNCPRSLLVKMAHCVIESRADELRGIAESN